ncbi:MAG: hypothetical protein ACXAC6_04645 [Candidatus Hodarchaeales archaeon]|jgi:hypothetical protein
MDINWNLIFVIAIIAHAIGHTLGVIHTFDIVTLSGMPSNESWLLTGQLKMGQTVIRIISVLWVVVVIGFLITAGAFWFEVSWWKNLATLMVVLSIVLFTIWFNSFPINTSIGATIGNIVVIVGLLQFN